ncbi:DUF397 domain-containing protein [Pseudonocardia sp. HH130630-07]|uniref:DUF397 domain-containing protein n=1 Tax=Pseudonocardia sp. HH130630-07 TaxID=1690815 RepID=UPI000814EC74|nr:DUF397 domain-containing protein [Pseudonocardia sp. HH130630-07]ANY05213.1 DUF397 domain-containing protein [Pseudonocardia sp. HH130630-07]
MTDRTSSDLQFRKSSFSSTDQGCVEVADDPTGGRWLRDTKDRSLAPHYFTEQEWTAFLAGVRNGEFD